MSASLLIDCGTTNLRAMLVDENGQVLAQEERPGGVRHTAIDGHNGRLKTLLKECIEKTLENAGMTAESVKRCVAYGMITSNMGLLEISHLPAPAGAEELRRGMRTADFPDIAPFPISFIPGVRNFSGEVTPDNFSGMDMMRGEETEAVGLFRLLQPNQDCVMILPGSHNKFVRMDAQGRILGCMTSISGEMLDALTHDTILADAVGGQFASAETYCADMVCKGARECAESGLGRAAFAGRILNQLGHVDSVRLRSYLLGAVLAEDVQALKRFLPASQVRILIAGKPPLQRAFADAMFALGMENAHQIDRKISAQMGICGAMTIAG